MKKIIVGVLLAASVGVAYACEPWGWVLVRQGQLSATETVCTYEKNGYQTSIVVSNAVCPLSPCSKRSVR